MIGAGEKQGMNYWLSQKAGPGFVQNRIMAYIYFDFDYDLILQFILYPWYNGKKNKYCFIKKLLNYIFSNC